MKKIARVALDILTILITIAALAVIIPRVFGIRTFGVLSGSMEPAYPTGSLVYAVPQKQENIKIGDAITYVLNAQKTVVTHRVVDINPETRDYIVKGDANPVADAGEVNYKNVIGVVKFHIPLAGYAVSFALTLQGRIIVITLIIVLILLMILLQDDMPQTDHALQKKQAIKAKKSQQNIEFTAEKRVYDSSNRYQSRYSKK